MYGRLQGLYITKDRGVEDIIIFADSLLIIQYLKNENSLKDNSLAMVLQRIRSIVVLFHSRRFYHILRNNNVDVDLGNTMWKLIRK